MKSSLVSHFLAMLYKRFRYQIKDYVGMMCEVLLPIVFICIGLTIINIQFINAFPKIDLSTNLYFEPSDVIASNSVGFNIDSINDSFISE